MYAQDNNTLPVWIISSQAHHHISINSQPFLVGIVSEDDDSPELTPTLASYYQHLIGVLHWIVELGRVDLVTEVSILASQMAMPRRGHLDAALHVVAHLKSRSNARMVFDPTYPDIYHHE